MAGEAALARGAMEAIATPPVLLLPQPPPTPSPSMAATQHRHPRGTPRARPPTLPRPRTEPRPPRVGQAAHTVAMGCSSRVSLQCSLQRQAVGATTAMVASLRAMSRTVATSLATMANPPPILTGASMPVAMATNPVLTIQTSSLKGTMVALPHLKEAMVGLPQGGIMGDHRALTMGHPLPRMEVMVGKVVDLTRTVVGATVVAPTMGTVAGAAPATASGVSQLTWSCRRTQSLSPACPPMPPRMTSRITLALLG